MTKQLEAELQCARAEITGLKLELLRVQDQRNLAERDYRELGRVFSAATHLPETLIAAVKELPTYYDGSDSVQLTNAVKSVKWRLQRSEADLAKANSQLNRMSIGWAITIIVALGWWAISYAWN